jgi:hypothetical protein
MPDWVGTALQKYQAGGKAGIAVPPWQFLCKLAFQRRPKYVISSTKHTVVPTSRLSVRAVSVDFLLKLIPSPRPRL